MMSKLICKSQPLRVMFDTNTYRHIINCSADNDNSACVYKRLNRMIRRGLIEAFLSETLFTIEAIKKNDRLAFIASQQPKTTSRTRISGNTINTTVTLGPDDNHRVNFEGTGPLREYFEKALKLGFKIIRLPRIAGIMNADIKDEQLYKIKNSDDFHSYNNKAGEVGQKIESNGAGFAHILQILSQYDNQTNDIYKKFDLLFADVNKLPDSQRNIEIQKVAKAIAELSDGDSVACSIGLNCDAFCTNDRAVAAGQHSVFSANNVLWLKNDYGFNKLSPTELVSFVRRNNCFVLRLWNYVVELFCNSNK